MAYQPSDVVVEADAAAQTLAEEIRRRRERAGLSHTDLALVIRYSRDYVGRAERPRKGLPSALLVAALDDALDAEGALIDLRNQALARRLTSRRTPSTAPDRGEPGGKRDPSLRSSSRPLLAPIRRPSERAGEETDDSPGILVGQATSGKGESMKRREFLGHAAAMAVGAVGFDIEQWTRLAWAGEPLPHRLGSADVGAVEDLTATLREMDYKQGGGTTRMLAVSHLGRVHEMMSVPATDEVRRRLWLAAADLHNLAGWVSMDVGRTDEARHHFSRALELAQAVDEPSLVANVLYRAGRLHLHHGWPEDALRLFQLGQIPAKDSGSEATVALLYANEAWARGQLGDVAQARKAILRARDEFSRANVASEPRWVNFFNSADLDALDGVLHVELAATRSEYAEVAVERLTRSLAERGPEMARSKAFETIAIATGHLLAGNRDEGVRAGRQAMDSADQIFSHRVRDRLLPLRKVALTHHHEDARELVSRVDALTRPQPGDARRNT